jgi:tetratricopeptide (TPR) repeat protein
MKTVLALLLSLAHPIFAQVQLPELSPRATIIEDIGYTRFEIQYGRPAARERKIFGALVPYQRLWRTGAGKGTWLIVNTDVFINGKRIPAGAYAFVTIPGENEWTILLNSDTSKIYGEPSEYDVAHEVLRTTVNPEKTGHFYESLTIYLDSRKYDAELYLAWEDTQIHFPIITKSRQKAAAAIEDALKNDPRNVATLNEAAFFYYMNNESPDQIMRWLDQALAVREDRWTYHQKIGLLEKMKNYAEARKTATKAITYLKREKTDNDGWEYSVREFETKLKTWPQ